MAIHILTEQLWFPPVEDAEEDGLLAVGGNLSKERLLLAYKSGIFPWFEEKIPMWWCPDPRFVLYPQHLKVSKSMQQLFKKQAFDFRINTAFSAVIQHCKSIFRPGQYGTWITKEVENAYNDLHKAGYAHSAEVWQNNELLGGLYGIKMGNIFFGESMFSLVSDASKYAFISYVNQLVTEGIQLIDCQVYTPHLESLGATMISREYFMLLLDKYIL
ncbi:MAG: leucyl/phenylalanyl-tRNA--protein transferase [Sphingobacteriia bacterium]|nr:MAG: leucyl/phenylalanyl-tRNA--protein transferase [Sphingobacteriia bacterium]